jgi:hypothetical protein
MFAATNKGAKRQVDAVMFFFLLVSRLGLSLWRVSSRRDFILNNECGLRDIVDPLRAMDTKYEKPKEATENALWLNGYGYAEMGAIRNGIRHLRKNKGETTLNPTIAPYALQEEVCDYLA